MPLDGGVKGRRVVMKRHKIQKGTGKARCKYCGGIITPDQDEVVDLGNVYEYSKHYHLHPTEDCEGWINQEREFIEALVETMERTCRGCYHLEGNETDGYTCHEGGFSEIGDIDIIRTEEDCNAWSACYEQ